MISWGWGFGRWAELWSGPQRLLLFSSFEVVSNCIRLRCKLLR